MPLVYRSIDSSPDHKERKRGGRLLAPRANPEAAGCYLLH